MAGITTTKAGDQELAAVEENDNRVRRADGPSKETDREAYVAALQAGSGSVQSILISPERWDALPLAAPPI